MDYPTIGPVAGSKIHRELAHGAARRGAVGAVGAASRNHRELIHGETENGDPLWGLNAALRVRAIHGGFGYHVMVIRVQFMEIWIHGGL